jgi:hypothetical protein
MPAAITAKRRTSWTGPMRNVKGVRWPNIFLDLIAETRAQEGGAAGGGGSDGEATATAIATRQRWSSL